MTVFCFSVNQSGRGETEYAKQQKKISQLRDELVALEKTCSQLDEEIADNQQALIKGKEKRDKLRYRNALRKVAPPQYLLAWSFTYILNVDQVGGEERPHFVRLQGEE